MKTAKYLQMLPTIVVLTLGMAACDEENGNGGDGNIDNNIVGTWRLTFADGYHQFTFTADGRVYEELQEGGTNYTDSGTFTTLDGILFTDYGNGDTEKDPYSVNGDTLTIGGDVYTRIA